MTKDEALKVEGPLHVVCQCNWCKAHPEQNLSCKLVQARLAAAWGFVKAQPEPWEKFCDSNCVWTDHHPDCKLAQPVVDKSAAVRIATALGWTPHRTWVGLTEDEAFACKGRDYFETYKAIEAKLKEKNT